MPSALGFALRIDGHKRVRTADEAAPRLSEAWLRLGAVRRATDVGVAQTPPSSHGNLSQHGVAEHRRIAFTLARKGDYALREDFSFFLLIAGQVELAANFIKGS